MNLKIAFIGHNAEFTEQSFRKFMQDNADAISSTHIFPFYVNFQDGTEVFPIPPYAGEIVGKRFDQVIFTGILDDIPRFEILCWLSGQVPFAYAAMTYEY